jgi:chitinase
MSTTLSQPTPAGPHDGKRLSFWRVLLGVVVVAAVAAGAVVGARLIGADGARADQSQPWFAGYVDATLTPRYGFEDPAGDAERDVVLAFVVARTADDCTPSWGTAYGLDDAAHDLDLDRRIARLRQLGGDAVISFGGAVNTELATACTDIPALTSAYAAVVDRYDVSTIDLDIEADDLTDAVAGERRAAAVAAVQQRRRDHGEDLAVWLTLPVMPTGLTPDGVHVVSQMLAAGVEVAGVNVMTMDYGIDLEGRSMGQSAIDALTAVHQQLADQYSAAGDHLDDAEIWAKLGATPMIGQNDVPGEVFTLDDASVLNAFAQQKHLGRLSAWSLDRDRSCGPNYLDLTTVSNLCSGVDQGDTTFAGLLAPGFGTAPGAPSTATTTATSTSTPAPAASGSPAPGHGRDSEPPADDPATSPYPIWLTDSTYLVGAKVVWHGTVYEAKWWTKGDVPDDPVSDATDTPWALVGPVLQGEAPVTQPTVPAGTYPDWSGTTAYQGGERVLFEGVAYQAKWWTQGDSPAATRRDSDGSPWLPLTPTQAGSPPSSPDPAGGAG